LIHFNLFFNLAFNPFFNPGVGFDEFLAGFYKVVMFFIQFSKDLICLSCSISPLPAIMASPGGPPLQLLHCGWLFTQGGLFPQLHCNFSGTSKTCSIAHQAMLCRSACFLLLSNCQFVLCAMLGRSPFNKNGRKCAVRHDAENKTRTVNKSSKMPKTKFDLSNFLVNPQGLSACRGREPGSLRQR